MSAPRWRLSSTGVAHVALGRHWCGVDGIHRWGALCGGVAGEPAPASARRCAPCLAELRRLAALLPANEAAESP